MLEKAVCWIKQNSRSGARVLSVNSLCLSETHRRSAHTLTRVASIV